MKESIHHTLIDFLFWFSVSAPRFHPVKDFIKVFLVKPIAHPITRISGSLATVLFLFVPFYYNHFVNPSRNTRVFILQHSRDRISSYIPFGLNLIFSIRWKISMFYFDACNRLIDSHWLRIFLYLDIL